MVLEKAEYLDYV